MSVNPARRAAFEELVKFFREEKFSHLALDAAVERHGFTGADRALFTRLYCGVIEKKICADYLLSQLSSLPLNRVECEVLVLLELGLYQILWMDRVPDRAAVNECVELAKATKSSSSPFVNAVLRRATAEKETLPQLLDLPGKKGLALRESFPRYLVSLWIRQYGKETAERICREQNGPAALTLRVNTLKTDRARYGALLTEAGIPWHENPLCRNGITLEQRLSPTALPGWDEGLIFVQDAAAQRAADLLDAQPGEVVLDLCAAPGGKSFSAALDMADRGRVIAMDLYPARVNLIREGADRLGLTCLEAASGDATVPLREWEGKADRVLCDVPCSGFGVIAKKPDIRLRPKEERQALPSVQLAILKAGSRALRPGGRLVYATCTLNREENEDVVNAFLEENPAFHRIREAETLFPKAGENDGFYVDVMEKDA